MRAQVLDQRRKLVVGQRVGGDVVRSEYAFQFPLVRFRERVEGFVDKLVYVLVPIPKFLPCVLLGNDEVVERFALCDLLVAVLFEALLVLVLVGVGDRLVESSGRM